MQQRGRLQNNCRTQNACPSHEQSTETDHESIRSAQVGRPLAAAIQDQKLMPDQHGFGNHAAETARLCQPN